MKSNNFAARSTQFAVLFFLLLEVSTKSSFGQDQINYSSTITGATYAGEKVFNAKMNLDSYLDMVWYNAASNSLKVLENNGIPGYVNNVSNMEFHFTAFQYTLPVGENLIDVKNMNGGGPADLLTYKPDPIMGDQLIWHENTGSGFNNALPIGTLPPASYQIGTIDMDNDGNLDVYAYDPSTSNLYFRTFTGAPISNINLNLPANAIVHFFSGHFEYLNNYTDLCYVAEKPNVNNPSDYIVQVLKNNNGSSFSTSFNSLYSGSPDQQFFTGKFTNDDYSDISIYAPGDVNANIKGKIYVVENAAGTNFIPSTLWQDNLTAPTDAYFKLDAGNYNNISAKDDIILVENATALFNAADLGSVYVDKNTGANTFDLMELKIAPCGSNPVISNSQDYHLIQGDFDNDNVMDVVLYNPSLPALKVGLMNNLTISKVEGYCWPQSEFPGQNIKFYISGTAMAGTIEFFQYESRDENVIETPMPFASFPINIIMQTSPTNNVVKDGCGWSSSYTLYIPNSWPSGYYAAKVTNINCESTSINFIVKADPNDQSTKKLLLLANTNTWAAYNTYTLANGPQQGSKYDEGNVSQYQEYSFMRPSSNNNITSNSNTHLARAELWVYTWLKDNGYDPDVITDMDLHLPTGNFINNYEYLVMSTHPEYWTGAMYDNVKIFQENGGNGNGGNLICLGGNAVFEVVDIDLMTPNNPKLIAYPDNLNQQENIQYPLQGPYPVGGTLGSSPFVDQGIVKRDRFDYFLETYNFGVVGGTVELKRSIDLIGTHYQNLASLGVSNTSYTKSLIINTPLFNGVGNNEIGTYGYNSHDGVTPNGDGSAAGWECDRYTSAVAPGAISPLTPASPTGGNASVYAGQVQILASSTPNQFSNPSITQGFFFPNGMNNSEIVYVPARCNAPKRGFVFTAGSICFGGSLVWNYVGGANPYDNDLSRLMNNVLGGNHMQITVTNFSNVDCNNNLTGSLTAVAIGGSGVFVYSLNGGATQANGIFNNLGAATYTIVATDANGCTVSTTQTIAQPTALTVNGTNITNVTCNGACDGTAQASGSGGTLPYAYSITAGAIDANTGSISTLCAGGFTVTVTDANNCSATTSINITQPVQVSVTASSTTINCNGGGSTITATGNGGTPVYSYSINGGAYQAGNTFSVLAGTYTITIKDANNCSATTTITITQPTQLSVFTTNLTNVSCNGFCDGTAQAGGSGGTLPYIYSISAPGVIDANTGTATSICAGTYTVTITDASLCSATTTFTITQPGVLVAGIPTFTNVTCNGSCDGTGQANGSGGTIPYTFSISAPGNINPSTGAITALCAGSYTVTIVDANSCTATTSLNITEPIPLTINTSNITNVNCNGGCNGTAQANGVGGTPSYAYTINAPGVINANGAITGLCAGNYTITVTDANGCTSSTTFEMIDPQSGNFCCLPLGPTVVNTPGVILKIAPLASTLLADYGTGGVITGKTFYIDDVLTVDQNISFVGCTLWFTPQGAVQLNGNVIFDVSASLLQASCSTWVGIITNDPQQKVKIENNTTIRQAIWGVYMTNNALAEISDSHFEENGYAGIFFSDLNVSNYLGYVVRNTFTSTNTLPGVGNNPYCGIVARNVTQLNIGDLGVAGDHNTFDGMHTGIYVYNTLPSGTSNIGAYNNLFTNIHDNNNLDYQKVNSCYLSPKGAAIFAKADANMNMVSYLDVQNTNSIFTFSNCDKAIVTLGSGLTAKKLTTNNCLLGIMCNSLYSRHYVIEDNNINEAHMGIQVSNWQRSASIKSNIIHVTKSVFSGFNMIYGPIGIKFDVAYDKYAGTSTYVHSIMDNEITINKIVGVGIYNGNADVRLTEKINTVNFATNNTVPAYNYNPQFLAGYWNENNNSSKYIQNTTNGINNPNVWLARSSMAMYMKQSKYCKLDCNRLKFTRFGFFVEGDNFTSKENIKYNKCNANGIPWLFSDFGSGPASTFGYVGDGTAVTGFDNANEFLSSTNLIDWRLLHPTLNQGNFKVFRISNYSTNDQISTTNSLLFFNESGPPLMEYQVGPNPNTYTDPCIDDDDDLPVEANVEGEIDSSELAYSMSIAMDSMQYVAFPIVGSWIDKLRLFNDLDTDSLLLNSSPELLSFYSSTSSSLIGTISYVNKKISILYDSSTNISNYSTRFHIADSVNNTIVNGEDWEMNEKMVNDVQLMLTYTSLDSVDSNVVYAIQNLASSCPFVEGSAVYRARTLWSLWQPNAVFDDRLLCMQGQNKNQDNSNLNIDSLLENSIKELVAKKQTNTMPSLATSTSKISAISNSEIEVYPNPASTQIVISYQSPNDGFFNLFNSFGEIILSTTLSKNNTKVQLQIQDIANGLYHYEVEFANMKRSIGKLTILK